MSVMNLNSLKVQLTKHAQVYRKQEFNRIHRFRSKPHSTAQKSTTKTDSWDLPKVVVSCASINAPEVVANGRNCSHLKAPVAVIANAYGSILDNSGKPLGESIHLGQKPSRTLTSKFGYGGEPSFIAGRCAEPHALQRLANKLSEKGLSIALDEVAFGTALEVDSSRERNYCATCKLAFPQLR